MVASATRVDHCLPDYFVFTSLAHLPADVFMLGMVHVCCLLFVLVNCCNDITVLTAQWARGNVPQSCMHLMFQPLILLCPLLTSLCATYVLSS